MRALSLCVLALLPSSLGADAPGGLVVEAAADGFAAWRAGLSAGDVLVRWERRPSPPANPDPASGPLRSPLDLDALEIEQASRGQVVLVGTRDGVPIEVVMPPGEWQLEARPSLDPDTLAAYAEGRRLVADGAIDDGLTRWVETADALRAAGDRVAAAWLLHRTATQAVTHRRFETAEAAFEAALEEARTANEGVHAAVVAFWTGVMHNDRNQWAPSERAFREAAGAEGAGRVLAARARRGLARLELQRGAIAASAAHTRAALAIVGAEAPDSLEMAAQLQESCTIRRRQGDLDAAEQACLQSLDLRERLVPDGLDVADTLAALGLVARARGDLAEAQRHQERSLGIRERLAPRSMDFASSLSSLGSLARLRGDLAVAEEYARRAVELTAELSPDSVFYAGRLNNLANVAWSRRDLDASERDHRRALAIRERLAPGSQEVAASLNNLGELLAARGRRREAEDSYRRALAINDRLAPDNVEGMRILQNLAALAWRRGGRAEARAHLARVTAVQDRFAPRGLMAAQTLRLRGEFALDTGDLDAAEAAFQEALALVREQAPGSAEEAEAWQRLATVAQRARRPRQAAHRYLRALDALETQRRAVGGSDEARSRFDAGYADYYRAAVRLLVRLERRAEAFQVLERYRARAFLALLAERDLVFAADVPPELDRERRVANAAYDEELARLAASRTDASRQRREALAAIRARQAAIRERIRASSPRLAALHYPEPLDLAGARATLPPGTLLLSYLVGDDDSHVFAVGPGPEDFAVRTLRVRRDRLRRDVAGFRRLLESGGALHRRRREALAGALSSALLVPVAAEVSRAERVVVVPDGPLHLLPFAALADPAGRLAAPPLSVVSSATVLAELRKRPRRAEAPRLVAFGDPDYSARPDLVPLPASREEVRAIDRLYGGGARTFLGRDATEERAKESGDATLLHLAGHAIADESAPLDSSLALAIPKDARGRDNGLLQAWEVFEQLRLAADLVTLSACGTGLGRDMSGEGVLGLTRAFQYAGARSVLASLWPVHDEATARLMARFYRHLQAGRDKDAALRAAQVETRDEPGAEPRHWAAFQLYGDWK
jgi:CHAT domain-containing protein